MIISDLYGVSALAGSIKSSGRISKMLNNFNKKHAYNKVCKNIDKITEYLSNTEIEDFIYVVSMYHKDGNVIKDLKIPGGTVWIHLISTPYRSIAFSFKYDKSNDLIYIKYSDGEINIAESHEKEYIPYNSSNMGEFDFDPRKMMGMAVNSSLRSICHDLIYREEE